MIVVWYKLDPTDTILYPEKNEKNNEKTCRMSVSVSEIEASYRGQSHKWNKSHFKRNSEVMIMEVREGIN